MNKLFSGIALALLLLPVVGNAAEAGSADAAKELIPEFLGKLYTVVETPVLKGDTATAKAKLADLTCNLVLKRTPSNPTGWVVEKVDCKKP